MTTKLRTTLITAAIVGTLAGASTLFAATETPPSRPGTMGGMMGGGQGDMAGMMNMMRQMSEMMENCNRMMKDMGQGSPAPKEQQDPPKRKG